MKLKQPKQKVRLQACLESEAHGYETFDYSDCKELRRGLARLVNSAVRQTKKDGIARRVGVTVTPQSEDGDESSDLY